MQHNTWMIGEKPRFRYQQVARILARTIQEQYQPGSRFASEPTLCAQFGVTRDTVRKAVELLTEEGFLERRGRAGTYVGDYRLARFDERLICVAMPIRNHLWDQLFLAISHAGVGHDRFPLICDFTGVNVANPFGEVLPREQCLERLEQCLAWRPRSLVLAHPELAPQVLTASPSFRHLILLRRYPLAGLPRTAAVTADSEGAWRCCGRHAREAGYERLCIVVTPPGTDLAVLQQDLASADGGGYPIERQCLVFEHHPDWPERLAEQANRPGSLAVLCSYGWGASQALKALRKAGVEPGERVGLYSMNDTAWSLQGQITSIRFDPDRWAQLIFEADDALLHDGATIDWRIPPTLVERQSTRRRG